MSEDNRPPLHEHRRVFSHRGLYLGLTPSIETRIHWSRALLERFMTSKTGHYSVIIAVALDVSCIIAEIFVELSACEKGNHGTGLKDASDALGIVSLAFSCLFMVELLAWLWAFGLRYFKSTFHCLDAAVIVASFVIDVLLQVLLRGVLEEIASLVVVFRLFRVFKIIEELSLGAEERLEDLHDRVKTLEKENRDLRSGIHGLQSRRSNGRAD